jgi:hypothetical protein
VERVLQAQSRLALLRRLLFAALGLVAGGIGHGVGFVEDNDAVETPAKPIDDLLHAAGFFAFGLRAQRRVGGEDDAFLERDRGTLTEARQGNDVGAVAADRRPVALGVLDQLVGFGDPESAAAALEPVVEDDAGDLAALAGAGAVAEEPAAAETHRVRGIGRCGHDDVERLVDRIGAGQMIAVRLAGIDDALELGVGEDPRRKQARRQVRLVGRMQGRHRGHGDRLHQPGRMRSGVRDPDRLQPIALVEAGRETAR